MGKGGWEEKKKKSVIYFHLFESRLILADEISRAWKFAIKSKRAENFGSKAISSR